LKQAPIIAALQEVLSAIGEAVRTDDVQLALVLHEPAKGHPSVARLLAALRAEPSLSIFDGPMQVVANQASRVEIGNLAGWLLRRGLEVGSTQAIGDLQRYLEASDIPFSMILGLTGLKVAGRCDLGGGIALLPWDQLPDSHQKHTIYTRFLESFSFKWPSAAIVQEVVLPRLHVSDRESQQHMRQLDESELRDAILCIGAVGPFAPEVLISWLAPPPWAPVMAGGFSLPHPEGGSRHDVWSEEHCRIAVRLFHHFRALNAEMKDALRLPLQRLSMAMRRLSKVDSAVDLGIALESLFLGDLPDDRGELTFRLRLRVARYMGQDRDRRANLFQLVGNLYTLRSIAVHTGRVPPHLKGSDTADVLQDGFKLTADAIRRFVLEGLPDWTAVQLQ